MDQDFDAEQEKLKKSIEVQLLTAWQFILS